MTRNEATNLIIAAARTVMDELAEHGEVSAEAQDDLLVGLQGYDSTPDSEGGSIVAPLSKSTGGARQYPNAVLVLFANSPDREAFYEALYTLPAPPSQEQKP